LVAFDSALKLYPGDASIWMQKAETLRLWTGLKEAIQNYDNTINIIGDNEELMPMYARACL